MGNSFESQQRNSLKLLQLESDIVSVHCKGGLLSMKRLAVTCKTDVLGSISSHQTRSLLGGVEAKTSCQHISKQLSEFIFIFLKTFSSGN